MSATTTSTQILHYTTTFLSEMLSQSHLRRHIYSTFLQKLDSSDQTTLKMLKFASETLEDSLSTTSSSIRFSSLRLAKELLSKSDNPFSSFLLSLTYSHCRRQIDAALCLLDVFYTDPSFARVEIAPFLFEELFLIHFLPILEWHNGQRNKILSTLPLNSDYNSDDQSVVSNTTVLSKMSGDQASELKDLERDYEDLLDENCRNFVGYFKEVLQNRDGKSLIAPPSVVLEKNERGYKFDYGEEKKVRIQEFASRNGRYNPMWTEGNNVSSTELNSNGMKSLSKFPSLIPQRVSPKVFIDERSSKISETASIHGIDSTAESRTNDNLSDYSSSDSEVEQEGKIQKTASMDTRQSQSKKKKQLFLAESSHSPDHLMEDDSDTLASGGKNTPPKDFVCPITTHIFDDPVTLETGQTYERRAIQEWIDRGNSTCPITRQKLQSTQLSKTNYVLKRLIASWQEQNPGSEFAKSEVKVTQPVNEPKFNAPIHTASSPNSVISQATIEGRMSELRLALNDLCTSEILMESEQAVLKIERFLQGANTEMEMRSLLSKPSVINGFVEILFNSVDPRVLGATVLILYELGLRDDSVIQTLTRVDSDVDCIIALFKKGLMEAIVLIYLLKPSAISLIEMEMVDSLIQMLSIVKTTEFPKMCMKPEKALVVLLGQILRNSDERSLSKSAKSILSTKAIENIVLSLEADGLEERIAAVGILLRCILEDGKCRNMIAEKAEITRLMESFPVVDDGERFEIVHFLAELVKLNRRILNEQILHILKEEGSFSTIHTLLTYLQNALPDQCPIVAGLLLQLDLLVEPRKMSIYREEAIDTLISSLRNSEYPRAQITAAETILSLQGRFSYSGKSLARAILLKRAGLDRSYKAFMKKDQCRQTTFDETMEEEQAADWERKVAFVLVSHEFGLLFEALAEGLKSKYTELQSVCFMSATWLVHMLSILPDTGIRGAARVCLLKHFVSIFKSQMNTDDRALAMLALNSFIHDPDALQDLTVHMKDILKGLRELKKLSPMAFEMLRVFSEEHDNSADLWNHKGLAQEECSSNGEVVSIACFNGKIFSGHSDGTIKFWTCKGTSFHLNQEIREHSKSVTSLVMLHSAEKLYSGSLDKTIRVWSIMEEGIHCEQVHETKDQINNLLVANNIACYISQGSGVKVHSWSGSSKVLNPNKYVKCLALVQGKLYCGCHDNSIQEIDLVTGTIGNIQIGSKKLLGKAYPIYAIQVQDGLIYSAGLSLDGANVKIWSASNYNMVGSLPSTLEVREMVVSSELIYLGCKSGTVEVWCKKKQTRVETLQSSANGKILCMAIDDDEDILVIGTSDGRIQAWKLS